MSTGNPYGDPNPPGDQPWTQTNPPGYGGPPGGGPPGYGGNPYMEPHRGTLILVLGIIGLVMCQLLGPVAWILGKGDLAKIRAGTMDPRGESETNIGMILGIVASVFLILQMLVVLLYFGFIFCIIGVGVAGGGR